MDNKQRKNSLKNAKSKSLLDNSFLIFFFAPLILLLIKLTGYQIFYGEAGKTKFDTKQVLLLSAGSLFYLTVLIFAFS
jgi:hypothetical protein